MTEEDRKALAEIGFTPVGDLLEEAAIKLMLPTLLREAKAAESEAKP